LKNYVQSINRTRKLWQYISWRTVSI